VNVICTIYAWILSHARRAHLGCTHDARSNSVDRRGYSGAPWRRNLNRCQKHAAKRPPIVRSDGDDHSRLGMTSLCPLPGRFVGGWRFSLPSDPPSQCVFNVTVIPLTKVHDKVAVKIGAVLSRL
jgi:hypothetical protein